MKFLFSSLIVIGALSAQAQNRDSRYYEIKNVRIQEVQETRAGQSKFLHETADNFTEGCEATGSGLNSGDLVTQDPANPVNPIDLLDVIVDKIINIGKKIWAIVDAGRPVVNLKVDVAHALPAGVRCWSDLEGWNAPTTKLYEVSYENGFGSTVVDYAFRVSFISGGSYKGQGEYITMATIQPTRVQVAWGFRFDATATIPMVFNQGTKSKPLAGMEMLMHWKVESPLTHIQEAEAFFVNGKGLLQHIQ